MIAMPLGGDDKSSKRGAKFQSYVESFRGYTFEEVGSIDNERFKLLVWGGMDALTQAEVVLAFSVLYHDLPVVRFAGDFLFKNLDDTIRKAKKAHDQVV
jgi:hypothetical protein